MPVVVGIAAAVLLLILVAATGAFLLLVVVVALIAGVVRAVRRDVGAWLPIGLARTSSGRTGVHRSTDGRPEPDMVVIDTRPAGGTSGSDGQAATRRDIWVIHPDHTAHWEDEDAACPQCRVTAA